jgi:hypothetical protein
MEVSLYDSPIKMQEELKAKGIELSREGLDALTEQLIAIGE